MQVYRMPLNVRRPGGKLGSWSQYWQMQLRVGLRRGLEAPSLPLPPDSCAPAPSCLPLLLLPANSTSPDKYEGQAKNKLPQPQVSPLAPPRALPIFCLLMKRANLWPLLPPPYRIPSPWQAGFCTALLHQIFLPGWQMRLELLNSIDNCQYLTHLTSCQWHCDTDIHTVFPAPKISGGEKKNLSSLFPGFPRSQWFSAYKIWVAPSHFFHEPNFLCSFWNLSSCLEFHPQDSKTLNQAVTSFGSFSFSEKVQRINIFYFVGYTVPVPTMQSCSSLVP